MNRWSTFAFASGLLLVVVLEISKGQERTPSTVTPADYQRWRTEYKNWGRWGADDQKGTSNLITPQKIVSAAKLVKEGIVVSLAHAEPQKVEADVPAAGVFHRTTNAISATNTTDTYQVSYHGLSVAHMDSFCHFFFDDKMYNGFSAKENISNENGCAKDGVMAWREGIFTRAVLYDMPQLKGVDWIEPGTPITRADLEAWEKKAGVKVGPGDIIRAVRRPVEAARKDGALGGSGRRILRRHYSVIKAREPAFLGHDFNIDWAPRPGWGAEQNIPGNPIHQAALNWMGVNIVENWISNEWSKRRAGEALRVPGSPSRRCPSRAARVRR